MTGRRVFRALILLRVVILVKGSNTAYLGGVRTKVPQLLEEHGITAYELSKRSAGRISMNMAYRLARGDFRAVTPAVLDALCEVFGIDDPGPLFERDTPAKRGKGRRG